MQAVTITTLNSAYNDQLVEIVERKGIGHPDTMCDAMAEELSRTLCEYYLEHFGLVLHHNVDKALLWGGHSAPEFGGGQIIEPMEIFLAGRATCEYRGIKVPLEELVMESCNNWLNSSFHILDAERDVKLHSLIRPGSIDLVELYLRQEKTGIALANDTSCGVGYAPLSELERVVLHVEKTLNSPRTKSDHPEIGEDIKVMAVRRQDTIDLTIACAFIDQFISDKQDYSHKKSQLIKLVEQAAQKESDKTLTITANTADDIDKDSYYLTVTGTSAESGDDGEVGRGNRVNGLITPYRPMNMEAAAGKNPVTHVGKLYNLVAQRIAETIVTELDEVREACCYLVSRIGSPITEPQVVDIKLYMQESISTDEVRSQVQAITDAELSNVYKIRQQLIAGEIRVY
ncbi:MAG: methionine adenosyltransferase [Gammaproteobacteria bacterium]|nr:methionine adenosyltransferase [Gammaproteobacteria bacterium]